MNKKLGIQLMVYGVLLAGLAYLVHHLAPTIARPTLITGVAGGALCVVWGIRSILGHGSKAMSMLTIAPVSYVLISQAVMNWGGGTEGVPGRRMAGLVIVLLGVSSIGMLMRIAYAGTTFDGQPTNPQTPGKPDTQANVTRRLRKLSIPPPAQQGKASSP